MRYPKRQKGEPAEMYIGRLKKAIDAERDKFGALLDLLRAEPFAALREAGLMAHEIREAYQAWEADVAERARADLDARTGMMIERMK